MKNPITAARQVKYIFIVARFFFLRGGGVMTETER